MEVAETRSSRGHVYPIARRRDAGRRAAEDGLKARSTAWSTFGGVALPIALLLAVPVVVAWAYLPSASRANQEQYAVYSAFLSERVLNQWVAPNVPPAALHLVIESDTRPHDAGLRWFFWRYAMLAKDMPSLRASSYIDFRLRDRDPRTLQSKFDLPCSYELISGDQLRALERDTDAFAKRFPNSPGDLRLSSVGFNRDFTQALFYADWFCPLCGNGQFILMEKSGGEWHVAAESSDWIS